VPSLARYCLPWATCPVHTPDTEFKAKSKRCADVGYFEWQWVGKEKQPYYITPRNGSVLTFAGLWEEWRDRVNNETIASCTILITDANEFTRTIHDRMPVILDQENIGPWLTGDAGTELLKPAAEDAL
jgi:putative SOS response-associated peptidase YedK